MSHRFKVASCLGNSSHNVEVAITTQLRIRKRMVSGFSLGCDSQKDGQLKEGGVSLNARLYSAVVASGCPFDYREEVATECIALSKSDDAKLKKIQDLSFR